MKTKAINLKFANIGLEYIRSVFTKNALTISANFRFAFLKSATFTNSIRSSFLGIPIFVGISEIIFLEILQIHYIQFVQKPKELFFLIF